jgi:hypothetical protein
MMQQQLLLIILAVILVGAAVALGAAMMSDQAVSTNRDQISADLMALGAKVQNYYRRPITFGGGDGSFRGLNIFKVTKDTANTNGSYSIVGTPSDQGPVRIRALGKERGTDGVNSVKVEMLVYPDTIALDPNNVN